MPAPQTLLSKLTERERTVLRMVCDGIIYRDIGAQIYLSEDAIKLEMGSVYIKLGLDHLSREERRKKLREVYCPVLKEAELPPPPPEPEQPEEVPGSVTDMVTDDERALVVWQQPRQIVEVAPIVDVTPRPIKVEPVRTRRLNGCLLLFVGMVAGVLVMLGIFLALRGSGNGSAPPLPTTTAIAQVTLVSQPVTVVVSATPAPVMSTATGTPSPFSPVPPSATPVSSPTPIPDTPPGSSLGVGDQWRQNGAGLRLTRYTLWPESSYQNIGLWFDFENLTDSDLLLSANKNDFIVTTGTGRPLVIDGFENCLTDAVLVPAHSRLSDICHDPANLGVKADLRDPSISDIKVRVLAFSSKINDAQFQFTIAR